MPPSFTSKVLRAATDIELAEIELEIATGGPLPVWEALLVVYKSGERGS